jgi:hypothetical protein
MAELEYSKALIPLALPLITIPAASPENQIYQHQHPTISTIDIFIKPNSSTPSKTPLQVL